MLNFFHQIQNHAIKSPDKVALWHYKGKDTITSMTFGELAEKSRQFAVAMHQHIPQQDAVIPMYVSKSFTGIAAMLGALGTGRVFTFLNKKLRLPQINTILDMTSAPLGLIDGTGAMSLRTELTAHSAFTRTPWWLLRDENFMKPHEKAIEKMRELGARIEDCPIPNGKEILPILSEDTTRKGCCLFTSGSTGIPKGVLITESDLRARALAEIAWFGLQPDDILLSILPFSFDVGLNQLLTALSVGCSLVLLDSWLPADILNATAKLKVTGISSVPTIWLDMLNADMVFDTVNEHAFLRYLTVSGGDLSLQHLKQLSRLAPNVNIFKTYGQTETFRTTSLRPEEFSVKPQSVGQAFGEVKFYVVREDNSCCAAQEVGEIVHTGLGTMLGYLDGQDPQQKLRPNPFKQTDDDAPIAVFTGDLGYVDEEGFLFLKGRRDTMLKIAGNRVYPREIINQLLEIPSVQEAEVVGIKVNDDTTLVAFIVLIAETDEISPVHIQRQLASRLPSYMVPQVIHSLQAIPRTASGKTDYPTLINYAQQKFSS